MKTERQRIFDMLVVEAKKPDIGIAIVAEACKLFIKSGMKPTADPSVRRPVPRDLTRKALIRQGGRCKRCNEALAFDEAEGDEVVARVLGGKIDPRNIVAMHKRCNASKNDNDLVTESKKSGNFMVDMFPEEFTDKLESILDEDIGNSKPSLASGLADPDDPRWDTVIYPPEE